MAKHTCGSTDTGDGQPCTQPVTRADFIARRVCNRHGGPTRPAATLPSGQVAPALAVQGMYVPGPLDLALQVDDASCWRAALAADLPAAPTLAGVTFRKIRKHGQDALLVNVPPNADPALATSWALSRAKLGERERVYVTQGIHEVAVGRELAAVWPPRLTPFFHGREDVAAQWLAAAELAGLRVPRGTRGDKDGCHDLGAPFGMVQVRLVNAPWVAHDVVAVAALLDAVDQGDSAAADRAALDLTTCLNLGTNAETRTWLDERRARDQLAGGPAYYGDLPPEGRAALLKVMYPGRAEDIDRALAIVGVGNYEMATATPCTYLTAAGQPCQNVTRSPGRWCGSCARRPAVSVATLPLVSMPAPAAPAAAYALTESTTLKEWTAVLRKELRDNPDIGATINPEKVKVVLHGGRFVATYPDRGLRHDWQLFDAHYGDTPAITGALRRLVDPELLLGGRVAARCELSGRRSHSDIEAATTYATATEDVAIRVVTARLHAKYGGLPGLAVTGGGERWSSLRADAPALDVSWTDGPSASSALGDYNTVAFAAEAHRTLTPTAIGMAALKRHLVADQYLSPHLSAWDIARTEDNPDRWDGPAAERFPQISPEWVAQIAQALGSLDDGGTDVAEFLRNDGLQGLCAMWDLDMPPGLDVPGGV